MLWRIKVSYSISTSLNYYLHDSDANEIFSTKQSLWNYVEIGISASSILQIVDNNILNNHKKNFLNLLQVQLYLHTYKAIGTYKPDW